MAENPLRRARLAIPGMTQGKLAKLAGTSQPQIKRLETFPEAPDSRKMTREWAVRIAPHLNITPEELLGFEPRLVPVIGRVGANPEGTVIYADAHATGDFVPPPPGGSDRVVALEVVGHSMRGVADDGALIYFEDQRTPPTEDMLGEVVVVEVDTGEVLVKRLLRGARPRTFDLESLAGPMREGARVVWAAHITAIVPPRTARRIIRRDLSATAAE